MIEYWGMNNEAEAMLKEFKVVIDRLPSHLTHIKTEADKLYNELSGKEDLVPQDVHKALVKIGKQEYPHRHALEDLLEAEGIEMKNQAIMNHVEPGVAAKLKPLFESGVGIEDIVKSNMFEVEFNAEERYQIENGILHYQHEMRDELPHFVSEHKTKYDKLLDKWQKHMIELEKMIDELRQLAPKDRHWTPEIRDKISLFEEGWSIVEKDPDELAIKKEIEYWQGTLGLDE